MMVPNQEKEHKKKCLLPDDGSNGSTGGSTSAVVGAVTPRGNKADLVRPFFVTHFARPLGF